MTIRSAIKRLQDLEAAHGDAELKLFVDDVGEDSEPFIESELVIDFHTVEGERSCFVMPQSFYETICDLTPKYRPIM